jgi:hypothetical protein
MDGRHSSSFMSPYHSKLVVVVSWGRKRPGIVGRAMHHSLPPNIISYVLLLLDGEEEQHAHAHTLAIYYINIYYNIPLHHQTLPPHLSHFLSFFSGVVVEPLVCPRPSVRPSAFVPYILFFVLFYMYSFFSAPSFIACSALTLR